MWNDLSMRDRAQLIRQAVSLGITNLDDIQQSYNQLATGGPKDNKDIKQWVLDDMARRIEAVENDKSNKEGGWNARKGVWEPHTSVEGGANTIHYGIKLVPANKEIVDLVKKQGYITNDQGWDYLKRTRLSNDYDTARKTFNTYNKDAQAWDSLSPKMQSILTDYQFNVGNGGLSVFKNLMNAAYNNDLEGLNREYKRYTGGLELTRNKHIKNELDSIQNGFYNIMTEKPIEENNSDVSDVYTDGKLMEYVKAMEESNSKTQPMTTPYNDGNIGEFVKSLPYYKGTPMTMPYNDGWLPGKKADGGKINRLVNKFSGTEQPTQQMDSRPSFPWIEMARQEEQAYQNAMQEPYFQVNGKISKDEWRERNRPRDPGQITQSKYPSSPIGLGQIIDEYVREAKYRANNSELMLHGKYGLPLAGLAAGAGAAAGSVLPTILANPYVDAGLVSMGGAHAAQSIANGEADWMTALELAPLTSYTRPMWNIGKTGLKYATDATNNIANNINNTYKSYRLSQAINNEVKANALITGYNRNPRIVDTGNLWDYQSYLDQVFPNTKTKDILWHGSKVRNLETFDTSMIGSNMPIKESVGMYLSPYKDVGESYGRKGGVYSVLLNTENPYIHNQIFGLPKNGINVARISPKVKNTLLKDYDAVIAPKRGEIAFFDPNNALILGSNKDLQGFKQFMSNKTRTPQITAENAASINISPEELYKVLQKQEGYYFMGHGTGRTNVDPEVIFNNGLRIKNGDITNTTSPVSESNLVTWPHANSKEVIILPAKAENTMFDSAYGRIPSDWYDANTFQWTDNPGFLGEGPFAVQKPNATFVESEINGVPGVYTKPEAILGSYNTKTHTLRLNPNSQYKFQFGETSTTPQITADYPNIFEIKNDIDFYNAANEFAQKYGYQTFDKSLLNDRNALEEAVKKMLNRHNTFYRGVVGDDATKRIAVDTPWKKGEGIWVSPEADYAQLYGQVGKLQRPYTLSDNRMNWFKDADFNYSFADDNVGLINPWQRNPKLYEDIIIDRSIPHEIYAKDKLNFIDWVDDVNNAVGSRNVMIYRYGGPIVQTANKFSGTEQPTQKIDRGNQPLYDGQIGFGFGYNPETFERYYTGFYNPFNNSYNNATWVDENDEYNIGLPTVTIRPSGESMVNRAQEKAAPVVRDVLLGSAALAGGIPALVNAASKIPFSALKPGGAFWTNPLTVGTLAAEGINAGVKAVTPYNSVGDIVGSTLEKITGANPNNTWIGPIFTEAFNPGWYVSPTGVINTVGKVGNAVGKGLNKAGTFMASPYTGKWTTIGNRQYRLSPNTLGMNGVPIESRNFVNELPIDESRYYRSVDRDAFDSYKQTGMISQYDVNGGLRSSYSVPMFTKGKPSEYRIGINDYNKVWVVSKPNAKLEWESVKGAAMSPKVKGEFNKAPISDFDFYVYHPQKGYIKLDENLNLPGGISVSRTPHIDYLKSLSREEQIKYLTENGLNDQWLWTLENNPDHLESTLSKALIPDKTLHITLENAASITPEQWTAAQDAAIARGDMAEAQRLRDLHFSIKANKNYLVDANKPLDMYHNTDAKFTSFDLEKAGKHDKGYFGKGIYLSIESPQPRYGNNEMHLYANAENPLILDDYTSAVAKDAENFYNRGYHSLLEKEEQNLQKLKERKAAFDLQLSRDPDNSILLKMAQNRRKNQQRQLEYLLKDYPDDPFLRSLINIDDDISIPLERWKINQEIKEKGWGEFTRQVNLDNHDAVIPFRPSIYEKSSSPKNAIETVIKDERNVKSADAVTYDDDGVRIPLGKRDNFNINDIRYGLIPLAIGLSTYGLYNNWKSKGGKIHIKPSKRGTFTAAAKKHGKSVQAFASQVLANPSNYSPAMRKKANFARNAAKWHSYGGPIIYKHLGWDKRK